MAESDNNALVLIIILLYNTYNTYYNIYFCKYLVGLEQHLCRGGKTHYKHIFGTLMRV